MKALDTNVVLRVLMGDDITQTPIAEREFDHQVFLPLTVVLETAWVLGSKYRLTRAQAARMLTALLDRATVVVEAPEQLRWAISRFAELGDIADMVHLVASRMASSFATFDDGIAKAAGRDTPIQIETLV